MPPAPRPIPLLDLLPVGNACPELLHEGGPEGRIGLAEVPGKLLAPGGVQTFGRRDLGDQFIDRAGIQLGNRLNGAGSARGPTGRGGLARLGTPHRALCGGNRPRGSRGGPWRTGAARCQHESGNTKDQKSPSCAHGIADEAKGFFPRKRGRIILNRRPGCKARWEIWEAGAAQSRDHRSRRTGRGLAVGQTPTATANPPVAAQQIARIRQPDTVST